MSRLETWKLAGHLRLEVSNQIWLFERTGPITIAERSDFVHDKIISNWSDIAHHFRYRELLGDSLQLLFVNQVRGTPIGNLPICNTCRRDIDRGIQCSVDGPDVFNPKVPFPICCNPSQLEIPFDSIELLYDEVSFSNIFWKHGHKKEMENYQPKGQVQCTSVSQGLELSYSVFYMLKPNGIIFHGHQQQPLQI